MLSSLAAAGDAEGLEATLLSRPQAQGVTRILSALADPRRLRLLQALERGPLCPCVMREIEPVPNRVLSYHLRQLKMAGLVAVGAQSNFRIYEITPSGRRILGLAETILGESGAGRSSETK